MQFRENHGHPTAEQRHAKPGKICTTPGVKIMADKPPHLPPERHDVCKTCWFTKHADAAPNPNREEQELSHGYRKIPKQSEGKRRICDGNATLGEHRYPTARKRAWVKTTQCDFKRHRPRQGASPTTRGAETHAHVYTLTICIHVLSPKTGRVAHDT